jgi:hypothetical protein
MRSSKWASLVSIVGGLAWGASALLGWGEEPERYSYLAGLGLLIIAFAFAGYALVASAPIWLRAIVAVATPMLGYSVWLSVEGLATPYVLVLLAGIVAVVAGVIGLGRGTSDPGGTEPDPPVRGRRAAR